MSDFDIDSLEINALFLDKLRSRRNWGHIDVQAFNSYLSNIVIINSVLLDMSTAETELLQ